MKNHLISVIVPVYNICEYLSRCLDSILAQTYSNLEIIVVNDGSIDGSDKIINEFAARDNRIVPIHKENGGVSSARTAGVSVATGDYIGFVDGDDYIEPEMYEKLLQNALTYNADISHCGYKMVFPDGHEDLYYGTKSIVEQNNEQGLIDLLSGKFIEPGLWNKLYKRSVVNYVNSPLWDQNIKINEDLLLNYILFLNSQKSIYEDIPYYHYILRTGSAATSKNQLHKITDPLKVFTTLVNDTRKNDVLFPIAYTRYINLLVNISNQTDWKVEAQKARCNLRQNINEKHFFTSCTSLKVRTMARLAAYLPLVYRIVRSIYDVITGVRKKYEV